MTTFVRARIDDDVKETATAVLKNIGLSVSDVMRVLLTRIANDKAIPPGLFVPNAETIEAMKEGREMLRNGNVRFDTPQEMFDALSKAAKEAKAETAAQG